MSFVIERALELAGALVLAGLFWLWLTRWQRKHTYRGDR